ncbi:hypothetical protein ES332_D13G128800v1 [Gossypium tomentosum]|uniref:Uncharacterized protein n=1 Tax=Gossypium tomentosum TaxID=34277 RepID=A0A5D2HWF1_GOSTO|nr:hypothetical protein ES332_D13G128800v1 [Gossypium tomentosum]
MFAAKREVSSLIHSPFSLLSNISILLSLPCLSLPSSLIFSILFLRDHQVSNSLVESLTNSHQRSSLHRSNDEIRRKPPWTIFKESPEPS